MSDNVRDLDATQYQAAKQRLLSGRAPDPSTGAAPAPAMPAAPATSSSSSAKAPPANPPKGKRASEMTADEYASAKKALLRAGRGL